MQVVGERGSMEPNKSIAGLSTYSLEVKNCAVKASKN
jgi:hypothetical protein